LKTEDWLQLASLATVTVALFFSYKQTRDLSQQSSETAKQAAASASALQHSAHRQLSLFGADSHEYLFATQPGVLSWFLASRGIPLGSHEDNLRSSFMFQRLDVHESAFLWKMNGILSDDIWGGWQAVVVADAATPQFRKVWRAVRQQYARAFTEYIDTLVAIHDNPDQRVSPASITIAGRDLAAPTLRHPDHAELREGTAA
jgi:hypothetical protein